MTLAIQLSRIAKAYDGKLVLAATDLSIPRGQFVALVGGSGAGKTTLLKTINGLVRPSGGAVTIEGVDTATLDGPTLRRRIGYVFQDADDQLFMPTVEDDVAFGPLNLGLSPQAAVDLPNFGTLGGPLVLEQRRFPLATVEALQQRGHTVQQGELTSGAQALVRKQGAWMGGADPRREGIVSGD